MAGLVEGGLVAGEVLLRCDWMQSMSFPQAHTETNTMFYGPQRKEVAVFGCFVAQRHLDGRPTLKNVVIVTDVLDHTCEQATCLMEKCKEYVEDLPGLRRIWLFSDCGKHFRANEYAGDVYKHWSEALPAATIFLCYFIEKHGKGRVDALFALFKKWLADLLQVPKALYKEPELLVDAMQEPAQRLSMGDPEGAVHSVLFYSPAAKPALRWRLEAEALHIEKTYCLQMNHLSLKVCGKVPQIRDLVFPDRAGAAQGTLSGVTCTSQASSGQWCRGYYGQQTWDKKVPTKGSAFILGTRMDAQAQHGPTPESSDEEVAPWGRRYRRRMHHLLRRRSKQLRVRTAAQKRAAEAAEAAPMPESGGSSDGDISSESSSDSSEPSS